MDVTGSRMFLRMSLVAKAALISSCGNAPVERDFFSANTALLSKERMSAIQAQK